MYWIFSLVVCLYILCIENYCLSPSPKLIIHTCDIMLNKKLMVYCGIFQRREG